MMNKNIWFRDLDPRYTPQWPARVMSSSTGHIDGPDTPICYRASGTTFLGYQLICTVHIGFKSEQQSRLEAEQELKEKVQDTIDFQNQFSQKKST